MLLTLTLTWNAFAQTPPSRNLAPDFSVREATSRLVLVPVDMELFSISGGGVLEPKADWTEMAARHFKSAIATSKYIAGSNISTLNDSDMDELSEINALHGAVAQAVSFHHFSAFKLPTKNDRLDWSLTDAIKPLRDKTGADYALFTWVRDSYASPERKAAMIAMAIIGVGIGGGVQTGYASLVDLKDGRIVWFNRVLRPNGDLRDEKSAQETVESLLTSFPASK
jgi:hypothetical protein